MSSLRRMRAEDLLELAPCNLDPLTETYNAAFYLEYLARWPYCCYVLVGPDDEILFGDLADGADDNADSRSVPADDGRPPNIEGYILGKLESSPPPNMPSSEPYDPDTNTNIHYLPWHAHVTALSVAPSARRAGAARKLTAALEAQGDASRAWFVDLYVRSDNAVAITLYRGMGYSVFRRVPEYYSDGCDAFDMRKPLSRDVDRKHVREDGENHVVDPMFVW